MPGLLASAVARSAPRQGVVVRPAYPQRRFSSGFVSILAEQVKAAASAKHPGYNHESPLWAERKHPVYPSLWNRWFPHEPVPSSPSIWPYMVYCKEGKQYWWCNCGESKNQPWCDGGNKVPCTGSKLGFRPRLFEPKWSGWKLMCGCKKTNHHNGIESGASVILWCDLFPFRAAFIGFSSCFVFGVLSSWMFHP